MYPSANTLADVYSSKNLILVCQCHPPVVWRTSGDPFTSSGLLNLTYLQNKATHQQFLQVRRPMGSFTVPRSETVVSDAFPASWEFNRSRLENVKALWKQLGFCVIELAFGLKKAKFKTARGRYVWCEIGSFCACTDGFHRPCSSKVLTHLLSYWFDLAVLVETRSFSSACSRLKRTAVHDPLSTLLPWRCICNYSNYSKNYPKLNSSLIFVRKLYCITS